MIILMSRVKKTKKGDTKNRIYCFNFGFALWAFILITQSIVKSQWMMNYFLFQVLLAHKLTLKRWRLNLCFHLDALKNFVIALFYLRFGDFRTIQYIFFSFISFYTWYLLIYLYMIQEKLEISVFVLYKLWSDTNW